MARIAPLLVCALLLAGCAGGGNVAVDAPALSYLLNLDAAAEIGFELDDIRGVLTAIAPIVGTTRVIAATDKIGEAMKLEADQL